MVSSSLLSQRERFPGTRRWGRSFRALRRFGELVELFDRPRGSLNWETLRLRAGSARICACNLCPQGCAPSHRLVASEPPGVYHVHV
jgi:hypothetical protein